MFFWFNNGNLLEVFVIPVTERGYILVYTNTKNVGR